MRGLTRGPLTALGSKQASSKGREIVAIEARVECGGVHERSGGCINDAGTSSSPRRPYRGGISSRIKRADSSGCSNGVRCAEFSTRTNIALDICLAAASASAAG